jgi:hypothetical protein
VVRRSFNSRQATLRRLDKAFQAFFRRVKAFQAFFRRVKTGTAPGFPHCVRDNRPTQAAFTCVACRYPGHADVVGALDVLRAGPARQAA